MEEQATEQPEVLVLGAGLCGLAAASVLDERAVVLEAAERPGGLVRTEEFDGYWFDWVIHLLYFADDQTEDHIRQLMGPLLQPCLPEAVVTCAAGDAPFPVQMHLGALGPETAERCLAGFERATESQDDSPARHYEDMLRRSFGEELCELFFFPYNKKMWRRPLASLAPSGFHWNIRRPSLDAIKKGVFNPEHREAAYNSRGWYPRPPQGAKVRGMECLSLALADEVFDLRLGHRVTTWKTDAKRFVVDSPKGTSEFGFEKACLSTLPLPALLRMADRLPADLERGLSDLRWNRVVSIAVCVEGERPLDSGHWRYYSDEELCFTRLVFLHHFDPLLAPPTGFPLLVEIPLRAEDDPPTDDDCFARVQADLKRCGALPDGARIRSMHRLEANPAYVVFTPENQGLMEDARGFIESKGISPLGRYGRWEYSSMAGVLRDGFAWGNQVKVRGSA